MARFRRVDFALHLLGLFVLVLACLVCLASLVVGLPGTFAIAATALVYAWATGYAGVTWSTVGWLTAMAVLAEGLEFVSAAAGSAKQKPSRRVAASALLGGIVGGVLGTPFLFGVGSLLGALAGAFAGAALATGAEGHGAAAAMQHGLAALRGRLLGFVVKSAIGVLMVVFLLAAAI